MSRPRVRVDRQTVDLSAYPDLVVIYLGMRVRNLGGFRKLVSTGRQIRAGVRAEPDGPLLHEDLAFGIVPPHLGMRQYHK